jgi:hypothetical protein
MQGADAINEYLKYLSVAARNRQETDLLSTDADLYIQNDHFITESVN